MKLEIDNLDDSGTRDYTNAIDARELPRIRRRLNAPDEMEFGLMGLGEELPVPKSGARVALRKDDGTALFTGVLLENAEAVYEGTGPAYTWKTRAIGDECAYERKVLDWRPRFVKRSAGAVMRQLAEDSGVSADAVSVNDLAELNWYSTLATKSFGAHARDLAILARGVYRLRDGQLELRAIGAQTDVLAETDAVFDPDGLKLQSPDKLVNDVTVVGRLEPQAYVKDYFLGDGLTLRFGLSRTPFVRSNAYLIDEEYATLDARRWKASGAIGVSGGRCVVTGAASVEFAELVELGGALTLQHGEFAFTSASSGTLGGIYDGASSIAGFRASISGAQTLISAMLSGVPVGPTLTTRSNCKYRLTTRVYANEAFRRKQTFFSSQGATGGEPIASDARVILEVHEIDPAIPGSQAMASIVLYDGMIANAPAFITWRVLDVSGMHGNVAFTRAMKAPDVTVRGTIPGQTTRTRLISPLSDGGECSVSSEPALYFYSPYPSAMDEAMVASYRSTGRALARVRDEESIAANARVGDDGVRAEVRWLSSPAARTSAECEVAARVMLEDTLQAAWKGEYCCWNDALPGMASEVWPGDELSIAAPSRGAEFAAIIRGVDVEVTNVECERARYKLEFANDAASPLSLVWEGSSASEPLDLSRADAADFIADLPNAEFTAIDSISVAIDCGVGAPAGGGFEVRRSDRGWGKEADYNLVGRYTTRTFVLPRLSRVQEYHIRQFDAASRYSRHTTVLHLDYPL
jgi:hypothetical protein